MADLPRLSAIDSPAIGSGGTYRLVGLLSGNNFRKTRAAIVIWTKKRSILRTVVYSLAKGTP